MLPHEDHYILEICCFDGKLLASYYRKGASDIVGVIALRGLQSLLRRLGFAAWVHMSGSVYCYTCLRNYKFNPNPNP